MSRPPINGKGKTSTLELVALVVERSAPDPHRPRCSDACEERLAYIEKESAACYAQAELIAAKMRRLARVIDESDEVTECPEDDCDRPLTPIMAVPELIDDDEDSMVVHIDNLRAAAKID